MTMMVSEQHLVRLRDEIRNKPLETGEIRRVIGAGEQYISLAETQVLSTEYTYLYGFSIDAVQYRIYAKNNPRAAETA